MKRFVWALSAVGVFGLFALQHFTQVKGVELVGMAGTHRPAAVAAAKRFGVADIEEVDVLVGRRDIDLVYIATPPFLHHPQATAALEAGKHVICEKPLALSVDQADAMTDLAAKRDCLLVVNLMQRYNPLFDAIRQLIESKALGEPLHGYFENYASDEGLSADHWFWDRDKSGGYSSNTVSIFSICSPAGSVRVKWWRHNEACGRGPTSKSR